MVVGSVAASTMVVFRVFYTGARTYAWMIVPNLVLAWIPYLIAHWVDRLHKAGRPSIASTAALGAAWMAFLPNAPYLVTDLVHLTAFYDTMPLYYDIAMLVLFGGVGLYLGSASLRLMHQLVERHRGVVAGWAFATGVCVLSAVGIYLGRVDRWNSWDMLRAPHRVVLSALKVFTEADALLFVAALSLLQLVVYWIFRQTTAFATSESAY